MRAGALAAALVKPAVDARTRGPALERRLGTTVMNRSYRRGFGEVDPVSCQAN